MNEEDFKEWLTKLEFLDAEQMQWTLEKAPLADGKRLQRVR